MLGDDFRFWEASDKAARENGVRDIPLRDDDFGTMEILLRIIHLQNEVVPTKVSFQQLGEIAIVCDKYALRKCVVPWSVGRMYVLPIKSQTLYSNVEYLADVRYGLSTVCSVASKLRTEWGHPQYLANLALKWNLKGGGVNQQIPSDEIGFLSNSKTMVIGVDVMHPSPRSREGAPSVAGVVASIDERCG